MTKTFEQLSIQIPEELHDNLHIYCEFLSDEEQNDMSVVAANFFQAGVYNTNVVDILVGCEVNALNVNLNIIRYMAGKYNLSSYDSKKGSPIDLYFLLSQKKVDSNAHYTVIVTWNFYEQNQEFILNVMVRPDDSSSIATFKNTMNVSSQSNIGAIDQNTSTLEAATLSQSSKVTRRVTQSSSKTCNTSTEKK